RGLECPRVERRLAEGAVRAAVGLDEELALRLELAIVLPQERRQCHRPAAGRCGEHVAEQIATGETQRALARLDRDPHRSAADQTGIPREVLGELVLAQGGVAGDEDSLRLDERVALDAPAPKRSGE